MIETKEGMRYEVYHRPGARRDGRDFMAVTPDCVGGRAFGKTEGAAIGALKRIFLAKISQDIPITGRICSLSPSSRQRRMAVAVLITKLFDHWNLDQKDQLLILGLSPNSTASLARYRKGYPLANRRALLKRAANLLLIHTHLRILFPRNRERVYSWITTANLHFGKKSPLEVIKKKGMAGLFAVETHLAAETER